ncbi:hypothetical protein RQP46_005422 [Phenoliferia psychrophenolica]
MSTINSVNNDYGGFDSGDVSPVVPDFNSVRSNSSQSRHFMPGYTSKTMDRPPRNPDRISYGQQNPLVHPDDETESLGDRATWASDPRTREPYGAFGESDETTAQRDRMRESDMSALTLESTSGDPFHYTAYESLPSPSNQRFLEPEPSPPPRSDLPPPPRKDPPPPLSSSRNAGPVVRIGPPSPEFLPDPHESTHWRDDISAGTSSPSPSNYGFLNGSSPRTPDTSHSSPALSTNSSGRVRSQVAPKNFSRPIFVAPPTSARSDSYDSVNDTGQVTSSLGHSSQGGHSMSSSWEGRVEMESRNQHEAKARVAEAQLASTAAASEWRPVDRGHDSPAPHTDYPQEGREPESNRSTLTPHSYAADQAGSPAFASPSYRLDSYYAAPGAHLSTSFQSSTSLDSPSLPSPNGRGDVEPAWPRVNDSPGKGRNTLKKKAPTQETTEPHNRWMPFRSKSKSQSTRSREVRDDGIEEDYRFSGSTIGSQEPPVIHFAEALPPAELGMSPDDIMRRQHAEEAARRLRMQPLQREKPSYKPGAGHSVVGSYVDGAEGRPRPPGWEAQEDVEQLDDALRLPSPSMPRAATSGPQRLPDPSSPVPSGHVRNPSLYSNYSEFYTFPDEGLQSRTASAPGTRQQSPAGSPHAVKFAAATNPTPPAGTLAKAKAGSSRQGDLPIGDPVTPEDYLQLGIKFHEDGDLERSAWYLERSAKLNGGCGGGMLLHGLALRHGWGCQVNQELGFRYLQSAAELVVIELDKNGRDNSPDGAAKASKNELMLALYELGTSFRFGWGVEKDKKMAVSYFTLAADMGDPDAQSDLAFCYANGKGVKKDMKKAAKYYRLAIKQGGETFGLSWIYKNPIAVGRGPQIGFNQCNSTTGGDTSLCQTLIANSVSDFCLWGSNLPNDTIGNIEASTVAYCTKDTHGARTIRAGAITGVQFMRTSAYIQITGHINQTALSLTEDDTGADLLGNPLGGLVYSTGLPSGDNSTYMQAVEWNNFVGGGAFCLKLCDPKITSPNYCQNIFDLIGCSYNMPAAYVDGVFESCEGDLQDPAGTYTSGGQTLTWSQPSELPATSTLPWTPRIPASSNCVTYKSNDLFSAAASSSGASSAATTGTDGKSTPVSGSKTGAAAATFSTSAGSSGASPLVGSGALLVTVGLNALLA